MHHKLCCGDRVLLISRKIPSPDDHRVGQLVRLLFMVRQTNVLLVFTFVSTRIDSWSTPPAGLTGHIANSLEEGGLRSGEG